MKGDFSRMSFDPTKHFSRVLMQQGRVTLDADHNEQGAIFLHALRTLTRDLFGAYGGPVDESGFGLVLLPSGAASNLSLAISAGHYYVDGILCECEGCTYDAQPDGYAPPAADALLGWLKSPMPGKFYWIYLDVWERHISWVEDDSIREVALGGPDTCTRSKVVWQVKALDLTSQPTCVSPLDGLPGLSAAWLAARLDPGALPPDPCVLAPDARYRGAENQLYRVEIHQGGSLAAGDQPSFKWSRENGSVVVPWLDTDGSDLIVTRVRGFDAGIWVELSDDDSELDGTPGQLVKLVKVEGDRLSVDPSTSLPARNAGRHPRVRRWDQTDNDAHPLVGGAVPVSEAAAGAGTGKDAGWTLTLEDGIQVLFASGGGYRTGEYWLIPARVATGAIEWSASKDPAAGPGDPAAVQPDGIEHHYAPLGIASAVAGNNEGTQISGCRVCFGSLPTQPCAQIDVTGIGGATGGPAPAARASGVVAAKPAAAVRASTANKGPRRAPKKPSRASK